MSETLGEFEQLVLFALLQLKEEAYGAAIRGVIEDRADRQVAAGAVYVTLERLENRGLLESRWGEPTSERGGRRRRYYNLRPRGAELLYRTYAGLRSLAEPMLPELRALAGDGGTDS